jgi:Domain of unknown function (DUF4148)
MNKRLVSFFRYRQLIPEPACLIPLIRAEVSRGQPQACLTRTNPQPQPPCRRVCCGFATLNGLPLDTIAPLPRSRGPLRRGPAFVFATLHMRFFAQHLHGARRGGRHFGLLGLLRLLDDLARQAGLRHAVFGFEIRLFFTRQRLPDERFGRGQLRRLIGTHEGHRHAACARATGTAGTVHITPEIIQGTSIEPDLFQKRGNIQRPSSVYSMHIAPHSPNTQESKVIKSIVIAVSLTTLTLSSAFAQNVTHQVTRVEVRHELEELEAAGYDPARGDDDSYPADLQAAEQRVAAKHRAERDAAMSASQNGQTEPTP